MNKIMEFARGKPCTVRLPGCNGNPETSVMSHVPSGTRYGKGLGKKPSDLLVAIACHECHGRVDSRIKHNMDKECVELYWWRGHGETLVMLEKEGILNAPLRSR